MKNHRHRISIALLFFAAFVLPANAQNETAVAPEAQPALCNAEVARALVETQIADGKTVDETDKRVQILTRGADFLWNFDEPTARKYFTEAFELARERFREKGIEGKSVSNGSARFMGERKDYRFEVLRAVAKRDAALAKKLAETFLEDIAEEKKAENFDEFKSTNEVESLLSIAESLFETNKPAALEFTRRAARFPLARNRSSRWHGFLYQLAKVDQAAADTIYAELLAFNGNAKIEQLLFLAGYPFGNSRVESGGSSIGANVPPNFAPNASLQRQFLNLLLNRASALQPETETPPDKNGWRDLPEAYYAFQGLQSLEPLVAERFPALLPRLSNAKNHAMTMLTPKNIENLNANRKNSERWQASFETKLANLEKETNPDKLDNLIVDLIVAAKSDAELVKAENWLVKISEEPVREGATNYLYFKRAEAAVEDARLADAEKFAAKVPELEHRAILFFKIAEAKLKQENDKMRAAEILDAVIAAALKAPNTTERAQVLLGTAFWFEKYNQYRAAEVLSEGVKTINRVENPNLSAAYIYRQIFGKNFGYMMSYSTPGYNLEKSFQTVAAKDFQGALSQAGNLSDKSLRTLAVIAVVSDCAAAEQKREPPAKKPAPKAKPKTNSN